MKRVACYVDGFNLYHAIDALRRPHLKWLDLWSLAASLCRSGEELTKVAYFSAFATWLPEEYKRHREYVAALKAVGVECHMARFNERTVTCRSCGTTWKKREEKETDVHFALIILENAMDGAFDRAVIVSADSDYVPAVRRVRARHPSAELLLAAPPGRHASARGMITVCGSSIELTAGRLSRCLFPAVVTGADGATVAVRPPPYEPPR